jgi:hypothetical protein
VSLGQSDGWFGLAVGPWSIWLLVAVDGRFPKVEETVRPTAKADNRCRFAPADADFLLLALAELPCDEAENDSLTIDLNGQVVMRGKSAKDAKPTELVMRNSTHDGQPRSYCTSREYLLRALRLGLRELALFGETTFQAQDAGRTLIWVPLSQEAAIPPRPDAIRIESQPASVGKSTPKTRRKKPATPVTQATSSPENHKPAIDSVHTKRRGARRTPPTLSCLSPLDQVKMLRESLLDVLAKNNELLRTLKRQQKQSKVVAATLASLKEFDSLSA